MNILIICNIVIIIASDSHKSNKYWTNVQIMSIMREILLYQIMINLASAGFQLRGFPLSRLKQINSARGQRTFSFEIIRFWQNFPPLSNFLD